MYTTMAFEVMKGWAPRILTYAGGTSRKDKNQILDPVSTAIKISLLKYRPVGTKLGLGKNRIYFHNPTLYQGLMRHVQGDEKSDIHVVICALEDFVVRYNSANPDILYLHKAIIDGLTRLMDCYGTPDENIVSQNINYFILKLSKIGARMDDSAGDNANISISIHSDGKSGNRLANAVGRDTVFYDHFRDVWGTGEIKIICSMLDELERSGDSASKQSAYMKAIHRIVAEKDDRTYAFVQKLVKY